MILVFILFSFFL